MNIPKYTQMLVNWYDTGDHKIGKHQDNEKEIYRNEKGEISVLSISLTDETGLERIFRLKPYGKGKNREDVELINGLFLVMSGLWDGKSEIFLT
uniref:2OG-Fe(II) oxygenase superfamily protein n=1 Tax=Pithovirus LCDPAC02 TaxID=2506601 RepID=A0A481YP27_9VIRU|nr:MAG: 2OG-Fe(II) oxygenase superfamily protein [Pithovirus LCDPAC02]